MYRSAGAANRYASDSVQTASPAKLLVMLYDRLLLDLDRATAAAENRDIQTTHSNLLHAQDIITELRNTLRLDVWDGAAALASLYSYCLTQLVSANVTKDPAPIREVRAHMAPLRDAWEAASAAPAQVPTKAPAQTPTPAPAQIPAQASASGFERRAESPHGLPRPTGTTSRVFA